MGFWSAYRSSLKPSEVEEPIDTWLQRPLGYLIARTLLPTPMTANQLTVASIPVGLAGGAFMIAQASHHMAIAAGFLFLSGVLDCADGQLARMRRAQSELGRTLDGIVDAVRTLAAVGGATWLFLDRYRDVRWGTALTLGLVALTVVTSLLHTTGYDHYKNVFVRLTRPEVHDGEDLEDAVAQLVEARREGSFPKRFGLSIYVGFLGGQRALLRFFDPYTRRLGDLPASTPERAAIYRVHATWPMDVWRSLFGFGSLVFGLGVFTAIGRLEWFVVYRLIVLNAVFFFYLAPVQRRASREAFRAMADPGASPDGDADGQPGQLTEPLMQRAVSPSTPQ